MAGRDCQNCEPPGFVIFINDFFCLACLPDSNSEAQHLQISEGADRIKPTVLQFACLFRDLRAVASICKSGSYPGIPIKSILTIDNVQIFATKIPVSLQCGYTSSIVRTMGAGAKLAHWRTAVAIRELRLVLCWGSPSTNTSTGTTEHALRPSSVSSCLPRRCGPSS